MLDQQPSAVGPLHPVFEYIADSIEAIAQALVDLSNASDRPGSRTRRALTDRTLHDDAWASRPQLEAFSLASRLSYHAGDHMLAVAACIRAPRVLYSVPTLVRVSVESAARAAFLLDASIDERERIRRWLNERLDSLMEESRLAAGLGDPAGDAAAEVCLERTRRIVEAATAYGFTVEHATLKPNSKGWISTPCLAPKRPSAQAVIDLMPLASGLGPTVYRWTSSVLHASDSGLISLLARDQAKPGGGPGMSIVPVGIDARMMTLWLAPALTAAQTVAERLAAVKGRDRGDWDATAQPILRKWRDWLRDEHSA